jgi:hypothetical protein
MKGREFIHLGHSGCGMPWKEHTFIGNEAICPDQRGWMPPWTGEEDEPDPPVAALFDSYEDER